MAEKVPSGIAPADTTSAGSLSVTSPDAHPRTNDIIMHNIATQPLSVEPPSTSHPHNAYVRPSGVQQPSASKPANKIALTGMHTGPRNVVLHRHNGDFGFTLRHFIVYPPDSVTDPSVYPLAAVGVYHFAQPMDTVFVKKVHPNSAAHRAGLQEGDRLLAVNGLTVATIPYSQVVATIQQTPKTLTLQVVPRNYDILQTFFSDTAYNPETNQRPLAQPCIPQVAVPMVHQEPHQAFPSHLLSMANAQKKQESLYSTLQEIVVENAENAGISRKKIAIYDEVPKILNRFKPSAQSSPHTATMSKAIGSKETTGFGMDLLRQQQYSYNSQQHQHQHQQQQKQHLQQQQIQQQQLQQQLQPQPQQLQQQRLYHQQQQQQLLHQKQQVQQQQQQLQQQQLQQHQLHQQQQQQLQEVQQQRQEQQQQQHLQLQQQHHQHYIEKMTVHDMDGKAFDAQPMMTTGAMAEDDYATPCRQGDSIRMSRLRKSLEQKEEFLRRPLEQFDRITMHSPQGTMHSDAAPVDGKDVQHREFYGRPNRFNKLVWPPSTHSPLQSVDHSATGVSDSNDHANKVSAMEYPAVEPAITSFSGSLSSSGAPNSTTKSENTSTMRTHVSQLSSIREQFFIGSTAVAENRCETIQPPPRSAPPSLTVTAIPVRSSPIAGTFSVASLPLPSHGVHGVSEKTKLFESGRALSPEGFDRMNLYKSELSRINTKQVVPNVAVRRKEFELKAESTSRRMSTEEKQRSVSSDSESNRTPVRMRSLSDEPNATQKSYGRASFPALNPFNEDAPKVEEGQCQEASVTHRSSPQFEPVHHQKPIGDDSYPNTSRNWTEVSTPTVIMRPKQQQSLAAGKDDRKVRRISYLRATDRDFHFIENDAAISSPKTMEDKTGETVIQSLETPTTNPSKQQDTSVNVTDGLVAGKTKSSAFVQSVQQKSHCAKSKALAYFRDSQADSSAPLLREGELNVKVTLIDGKRSTDRSWRTVQAELRGNRLKITHVRDGKVLTQHNPEPCGTIDLTNFHVTEGNYTKRKHVFKLATLVSSDCSTEASAIARSTDEHRAQSTSGLSSMGLSTTPGNISSAGTSSMRSSSSAMLPGSERELLLQADSHIDMQQWMDALRGVCADAGEEAVNLLHGVDSMNNLGGQQAEPQRIAAQTSVQVHSGNSGDDYSPIMSTKSHRKYALGSRSPSGQSPVTKTRKTPQTHPINSNNMGVNSAALESMSSKRNPVIPSNQYQLNQQTNNQLTIHQHQQHFGSGKENSDREGSSPKSKTWKGIVARQFRKMQGHPSDSGGSAHSTDLMVFPDGASINVPLQLCPVSEEEPYVPLVLAKCTGIVESKGLSVVGIYRIPGNTAAITQLTETINRGLDEVALSDARWEDVNVVSSLLKSFIRNLPEPLLPKELYGGFISADKLSGVRRLIELRQLLRRIPPMNYETLKHLMRHLYRVSMNSDVNLMDPRNLAIVFGPSVVRSANESLETAVKDMRHQCQIVEVLINHYQYFFEDGPLPNIEEKVIDTTVVDSGVEDPSTTLLLDNVSKIEPLKESKESSSGFVANIVQAANRKIRRSAQRKSTMSSTTPDTLSLDSTMSAESKEQSTRNTRRCVDVQKSRTITGSLSSDGKQVDEDPTILLLKTCTVESCPDSIPSKDIVDRGQHRIRLSKKEENLLQLHHHHHHHHHYYHNSRHHSNQSNDDASAISSRSSEDESNDSTFADNGDMSLKTVTIALDNKLRSLRNSSIDDSDRDVALECDGDMSSTYELVGTNDVPTGNLRHSLHQQYHMGRTARPLTLGENIPYADESPERPLVQSRSKPLRQSAGCFGAQHNIVAAGRGSSNVVTHSNDEVPSKKALNASCEGGSPNSSINDSCLTLVNEVDKDAAGAETGVLHPTVNDGEESGLAIASKGRDMVLSSDETDSSTTSNPHEKITATYRIDTEVLKKMNRILTQLERKANNLERKFNLNRSMSLNYKTPKAVDCCCVLQQGGVAGVGGTVQIPLGHAHAPLHYWSQQQPQQPHALQQLPTTNNNNVSNCYNQNSSGAAAGISSLRARLSLTKDEKTDKNINRRRLILDGHGSNIGSAPVGGTGAACQGATALADRGNHYDGKNGNAACGESSCPHTVVASSHPGGGQTSATNVSGRQRRHAGSRSIRRRHTVGGTHDYLSNKMNTQDYHHQYYTGHGCCPLRRT